MIWFIGITIVVIALIVGPVMMLRPNPAQQGRESLRAIAAARGIRFTFKKLPQQATEVEAPAPTAVYFFAPVNPQEVGSSRVDLQACKLEYSIVSPK